MTSNYWIGFWNLENLFDIENSPRRSERLERVIGGDLDGWTQELLNHKIHQLSSIITQMNDGRGPDILGICEIENQHVVELLRDSLDSLDRSYLVEHHDMSDRRGIDVAFIYDSELFSAEDHFSHFVMRRTATRDIFQVNFRTMGNRLIVLIGNHWPSRSGGRLESDGYRAIAGESLAYFHQRILQVHGSDSAILAMGDFNDEPFSRSLVIYALSNRSKRKVLNAKNPKLLNFMWPLMGERVGTFYFDNYPNVLDQFLGNKNILKSKSPIKLLQDSVRILRFPEMVASGKYPKPIRFGGMGKPVNLDGFSDHFPISILLRELD